MRYTAVAFFASLAFAAAPALAQSTNDQSSTNQNQNNRTGAKQMGNGANQGIKISVKNLSRSQIKKVQTALDNAGFDVGGVDGKWGAKSRSALTNFEKSKNLPTSRRLSQDALNDLGLNANQFTKGYYGSSKGSSGE